MTLEGVPWLHLRFLALDWKSAAGWMTVVATWVTGCSLRDLSDLGPGESSGMGGTSAGAGTVTVARAGGHPITQGGVNAGGASMTVPTDPSGGVDNIPGSTDVGTGGTGTTEGGAGTTAGGTSGTRRTIVCPAYNGTGGILLTPPSNDFEVDLGSWTRFAGSAGVSRVDDDGTACEEKAYLTCDGAARVPAAGWDGPAIDVLKYMVPGHSYDVTAVVRFNPASLPPGQRKIGLSQETLCDDGSEKRSPVQHTLTISNWVRVRNTTPLTFPPKGCSTVTRMRFYVETSEEEGSLSIDIDDFRLIDTTDSTAGTGGAAGAAGAAGASGAGRAGGAGRGSDSAGSAGSAGTAG